MRIWLPILMLLIAAGGVAAYFFQADGEEPSALDKHLAAEAARLAANPDAIEQEDAAWIAKQLGKDRSAKRLRELIIERFKHVTAQYATRIEEEYPEFYDYAGHRAKQLTGTNGMDDLNAVAKLAEHLRKDERFEPYFVDLERAIGQQPAEDNAAFMQETTPLKRAAEAALARDVLVFLPPKRESFGDSVEIPASYNITKAMLARALIHHKAGKIEHAATELGLAVQLMARLEMRGTLLAALVHHVADDLVLNHGVLMLATLDAVPVETLRGWLALRKSVSQDVLLLLAMELADGIRITAASGDEAFARDVWLSSLIRDDENKSVEQFFTEWHKEFAPRFGVFAYAREERKPIHAEGALKAAVLRSQETGYFGIANLRDEAEANWRWAALDLRILERVHGPLDENRELVDAALTDWPALRAEWRDDTLELWVKHEDTPWAKPSKLLITLSPLKE